MKRVALVSYFSPEIGGIIQLIENLSECFVKNNISVVKINKTSFYNLKKGNMNSKFNLMVKGIIQPFGVILRLLKNIPKYDNIIVESFSNFGFIPTIISVIIGNITKKPVYIHFHGGGGEEFIKKNYNLTRAIFSRAEKIVVSSDWMFNMMQKFNFETILIKDIYDHSKIKFKKRNIIAPKFIMTRALEKIYRHEIALEAFKIIQLKYPNASLKILGVGRREKELKMLTEFLELKNVEFIGHINFNKIDHFYNEADIYLNPTYPDNVSVAVLEAFGYGLPVVSAKGGGITTLIKNQNTGLFFKYDDCKDMANKIQTLLDNNDLVEELTLNARKLYESFSCNESILKWKEIL